jgi:hypothetical protein
MTMVEAADINLLTAPVSSGSATTATAQQELWRQCSRTVLEDTGTMSARTVWGASDDAQEKRAFSEPSGGSRHRLRCVKSATWFKKQFLHFFFKP